MKLFFGVNITNDKENIKIDGEEFVCERISGMQREQLDREIENIESVNNKIRAPLWLDILLGICWLVFAICVSVVIRSLDENFGVVDLFNKSPMLFYIGGVCGAIGLVMTVYLRTKAKRITQSEEMQMSVSRMEAISENALMSLGVPDTAKKVDCLLAYYKVKNEKIKIISTGVSQFTNLELSVFAKNNTLFFADVCQKFAVPIQEIIDIKTVKKHITFDSWNKDTPYNKNEFKPFKITFDNSGVYHLRQYCALEILHNGETYQLYFPPYELPVFTELTGLTPQE